MSQAEYRVLARKYRPDSFETLIGQATLVRTLTNALDSGRIAHAFMLTGVRGVGKTTTARLIARALNCVQGPTIAPCGVCDACISIAADRHPDVIEMDAASRTGIDDVRELIEAVRYRPVSARYKVYIIDEVHMLSKPAFNALLKTLEEPPPDIKFIFATTEINKVPVTVLSRCQRYTLPRIPAETLATYYGEIAAREGATIEPGALGLIARAADGSVRDGLSILDQAIALAFGDPITEAATRQMLGVADRGRSMDLFEMVMRGDAAAALDLLAVLYRDGAEPAMVLQDLLDITHFVTRLKLERAGSAVERAATEALPLADGHDRARGLDLAQRLGMAALARAWQMLLKGLAEVQSAPQPLQAAEMILIRLVYVTDLPTPSEIIKARMANGSAAPDAARPARMTSPGTAPASIASPSIAPNAMAPQSSAISGRTGHYPGQGGATAAAVRPDPEATAVVPAGDPAAETQPESFEALLDLVAARREGILYNQLASFVHPVRCEPGLFEFRPAADAPRDLASRLGKFLLAETGRRWMITVSGLPGAPTFRQAEASRHAQALEKAMADPLVRAVLTAFPGARIDRIDEREVARDPAAPPAVAVDTDDDTALAADAPGDDPDDPGPFAEPWDALDSGDD